MSIWCWIGAIWAGLGISAPVVLEIATYFWKERDGPFGFLRSDPKIAVLILVLFVLSGPIAFAIVIWGVIFRVLKPKVMAS